MATRSTTWAIYARISLDREGAGLGVDRQIADCRKLGRRLKLAGEPVVYADNDISATSGKRRPEYERLMAALRAGKHKTLLVWHTDRLHRRPVELEQFITIAETNGVMTHSVTSGPIDLSSPDGQLHARIAGAVARHEVQHKASAALGPLSRRPRTAGATVAVGRSATARPSRTSTAGSAPSTSTA